MKRLPNIHPGEILREEFLIPLQMTPYRLAKSISVSQTRISDILHERRDITADTALRLSRFFGVSAEFWMGLQAHYDLEKAKDLLRDQLQHITPNAARADEDELVAA